MTPLLQVWLDNWLECGGRALANSNDHLAQGAALLRVSSSNRGAPAVGRLPLDDRHSGPKWLCLDLWICTFHDSHPSLHVRSMCLPSFIMTTARDESTVCGVLPVFCLG